MSTLDTTTWGARAWVRLYTLGLPAELRDARRLEIDADMWEHARDLRDGGESALQSSIEILLRTLLGAFDDLTWRVEVEHARRAAFIHRRTPMFIPTAPQTRWMGVAGTIGGLLWVGMDVLPVSRNGSVRGLGLTAAAALFVLGILAFYAQQRATVTRSGTVGIILLLTSFLSLIALNIGGFFGLSGDALVANILGLAFGVLLAPGFLLLGFGMRGQARSIPLAIGAVLAWWMLVERRGDTPIGMTVFFLMGIGLSLMGYFTYRRASAEAPGL